MNKNNKKKVAVAMSGGVDSSVTAALLLQQGFDVIGITQQVWPSAGPEQKPFGGCCGLDAIESARRVAATLGIPHYVIDSRDIFSKSVVDTFCREYGRSRTPNPCVICNQIVRFDFLLNKIISMGINYLATGHYAKILKSGDSYLLLKGIDANKDQSYFLYTLGQYELSHTIFPLGDYRKPEIRTLARELGLPSSNRPDSQDICFVDGNYRDFISPSVNDMNGDIIDTEGTLLGKHQGLSKYTIGQRHGLGIAAAEPLYVVALDEDRNNVIVGTAGKLFSRRLTAVNLKWVSGKEPTLPLEIEAKIRYRASASRATLKVENNTAIVEFYENQRAIALGQSVVFYQGEQVLGGGIIEETGK